MVELLVKCDTLLDGSPKNHIPYLTAFHMVTCPEDKDLVQVEPFRPSNAVERWDRVGYA